MTLPLRTLPIAERWDCHCSGLCCRGTIIGLTDGDVEKIRQQQWDEHADFRGRTILVGHGLFSRRYTLAKQPNGACIFLTDAGLCRIHVERGEAAKPNVCRLFPLQIVPGRRGGAVTVRRYCPSAAEDNGRLLHEHLPQVKQLAAEAHLNDEPATPPALVAGYRRPWPDVERVTAALERMLLDERFPPVRRLAHGLSFCDLLQRARLHRAVESDFAPLVTMFETAALDDGKVAHAFAARRPPGLAGGLLFRQVALEYLRLHPKYVIEPSWAERWRLVKAAYRFARGTGSLPVLHDCFPPATFEALERPLGHLEPDVVGPLNRYFEAAAASQQYCMLGRARWSLVESFRALALSYAAAMWMLRLTAGDAPPVRPQMIDIVGALDRGQNFASLCGRRHRRRVGSLANLGDLTRLLIWYAR